MRTSTILSLVSPLAVAATLALTSGPARSATTAPSTIRLWNRAYTWQADTNIPGANLGDIRFVQGDAGEVTGTFPGGSLRGTAKGTKLTGLITLPGDLGVRQFKIKLDANTYDDFDGKINGIGTKNTFGALYRRTAGAETGSAKVNVLLKATALPKGHVLYPKLGRLTRGDLPADVVVFATAQNAGPDLLPSGKAHFQFEFVGAAPGQDPVLFRLHDMSVSRHYSISRTVDPVFWQHQDDVVSGEVVKFTHTATLGALGSAKDRAVFGVVVHLDAGFGSENFDAGHDASVRVTLNVVANEQSFPVQTYDVATSGASQPGLLLQVFRD